MPTPGPSARDLARFLRGELPRDEVRDVVRQLLRAVTGRDPMTPEAVAQIRMKEVVEELKRIERTLQTVHASLAPPAAARVAEEAGSEEDNDVATEIRAVIECVLADSLGPAARDLLAAALYRRADRAKG